jgi:hypothetical protein
VTVLCAGNVGACTMTGAVAYGYVMDVSANNWTVECFTLRLAKDNDVILDGRKPGSTNPDPRRAP